MIHNRKSGEIPTTEDDSDLYYHIKFGLQKNITYKRLMDAAESFLNYRPLWRETKEPTIYGGFNQSLLKNEQFEEVWKVMEEQSEWIINMIDSHKDSADAPIQHIVKLVHYFMNMLGLGNRSLLSYFSLSKAWSISSQLLLI